MWRRWWLIIFIRNSKIEIESGNIRRIRNFKRTTLDSLKIKWNLSKRDWSAIRRIKQIKEWKLRIEKSKSIIEIGIVGKEWKDWKSWNIILAILRKIIK